MATKMERCTILNKKSTVKVYLSRKNVCTIIGPFVRKGPTFGTNVLRENVFDRSKTSKTLIYFVNWQFLEKTTFT